MVALLLFILSGPLVILISRLVSATSPRKETNWLLKYKYAHRGLHGNGAPENSLAAFEKAIENGYAIELDVQLSKDGIPVVFHDKFLARMTGEGGKIGDKSLAELKELRLRGGSAEIPTLEEVLEFVDGRVPLLVELKNTGQVGKISNAVYGLIKNYHGKCAVQSFSPLILRWFAKNAPEVMRGRLSCDRIPDMGEVRGKIRSFFLSKMIYILQKFNLNLLCRPNFICHEISKVNTRFIKKLRESGTPVFGWTVQDEKQYEHALPYVDGVIFEGFVPDRKKSA